MGIAKIKNILSQFKRLLSIFLCRDKVSIIVTCYNCEQSLTRTVQSLLSQIYRNFEIILVDDCSTDNTKQLIKNLDAQYSKVTGIYLESNSGTYVAKNHGIKAATGKFLAFNDAGDTSSPFRIFCQLLYIAKHNVVGCFCSYVRKNSSGELVPESKGTYIRQALIGLVVLKEYTLNTVGYFDSVRMSGDSEYIARLRRVMGFKNIRYYEKVFYTAIEEEKSLTVSGPGAFTLCPETGKRKSPIIRNQYVEAYKQWHSNSSKKDLKINFEDKERKFPAPAEMLP